MQANQEDLPEADNGDGNVPDWERMFIDWASRFMKLMDHRCASNNTQSTAPSF